MKKMPCVFERTFALHETPLQHHTSRFVLHESPSAATEWVIRGEGIATRKWDGTACMVRDGMLYKRYDAKRDRKTGEFRLPPDGAIPCDVPDEMTGHWPHWLRVGIEPESKWHLQAWDEWLTRTDTIEDGTYELVGPPINGNPDNQTELVFKRHGDETYPELSSTPLSFAVLRTFLEATYIEGIVFHHPDGRMAKIRRADFGFPWGRASKTGAPKV